MCLHPFKEVEMETRKLGSIAGPIGIKGDVKIYLTTDRPEIFFQSGYALVGGVEKQIVTAREHKGMMVVKLSGVDDRNMAETLRGKEVHIKEEDLPALPEDTYYVRELIGLKAVDPAGEEIGHLTDVIKHSAQDLYEITKASGKKFLVPAVEDFVRGIDLEKGEITMSLIEGLDEE
jgi:16S rRNA processing protein RimM